MPRFRRSRSPVHTARRAAAALLAALALVLALRPAPGDAAPAEPADVPVTVAATDLPPGAVLTAADLSVAPFPAGLVPAGATPDPSSLVRRVLAGACAPVSPSPTSDWSARA